MDEGEITITFYANDSAGNIGSDVVLDLKDLSIPQITIYTPQENEFSGVDAPEFDIFIEEFNLDSTWYTIDGGLTNVTFTGHQGTIDQKKKEKKKKRANENE